MEKIVGSFQKILLEEIVAMMRGQKPVKHTQNLSIHSGFSVESTDSHASDASDIGLPLRLLAETGSHPPPPTDGLSPT
jgi:hypothetical protein